MPISQETTIFVRMDNQTTAKQLFQDLSAAPPEAAYEAAWQYLAKAKPAPAQPLRLIDPATGAFLLRFEANGTKYSVRTAEEGVPLLRFKKIQTLVAQMGFDASVSDQYAALDRIEKYFNKSEYIKAAGGILDMKMALSKAERAFPFAADACAMFILRDGEDITQLPTEAEIQAKVEDWNAAGLYAADFFFLCLSYSTAWNAVLNDFLLLIRGGA
jgi:hypothetical protein